MKLTASVLLCTCGLAQAQCRMEWSAVGGGTDGAVGAMAVFQGGLFVSGEFSHAGSLPAGRIARWDGAAGGGWTTNGPVDNFISMLPLAAYGPYLAVGAPVGNSEALTFWDGANWLAPLPGPPTSTWVGTFGTYHAPGGLELFVSGGFGGQNMDYVARWTGSAWAAAGQGLTSIATAFCEFDEGHGPRLFATGGMNIPDNGDDLFIARWDGQTWTPVRHGLNEMGWSLAVFDDGSGPALYIGGAFTRVDTHFQTDGMAANHIVRWDGTNWSEVGSGLDGAVKALAVFDDGGGPALYAGGVFTTGGGQVLNHIAKWRNGAWSAVGDGIDGEVDVLTVFGSRLFAGGTFATAGGRPAAHLASWGVWSANCDGSTAAPVLNVNDFTCFLNKFAAGEGYANCDGSTAAPVLNVMDFGCFLNAFVAGCR